MRDQLPGPRKIFLFVIPPLLLVGVIYGGTFAYHKLSRGPAGPYSQSGLADKTSLPDFEIPEPDGYKLFQYHCANCHGATGNGQGMAALNPRARYFGYDKFKFVSTVNPAKSGGGQPTDDDLLGVLKRGIAGSPMPSFGHLPESHLNALVRQIRRFARVEVIVERLKEQIKLKAEASDEGFDAKTEWSDAAIARMRVQAEAEHASGSPVEQLEPFPESSPASVARGKIVFEKAACLGCHGPTGKGDGPQAKDPKFLNENGTKAVPRDLTAGLFKGGADERHIFTRIYLGIPGTPMPMSGLNVPRNDIVDLVHFVKSLETK